VSLHVMAHYECNGPLRINCNTPPYIQAAQSHQTCHGTYILSSVSMYMWKVVEYNSRTCGQQTS